MKVLIYLLVDLGDESHNMLLQASLGKISCTTDIWSDINLRPFLAVTAHWIQHVIESSLSGPKSELELQVDLIGFHQIPGCHNGKHLAQTFLHILKWCKEYCVYPLILRSYRLKLQCLYHHTQSTRFACSTPISTHLSVPCPY
jgi:hypothetical protein